MRSISGETPFDGAAIVECLNIVRRRTNDAAYFVIPAVSLWWLRSYAHLADHLDSHAVRVTLSNNTAIYALHQDE